MAKITPESLAKPGTEHAIQSALFCWAAENRHRYAELRWLHSIPNGGSRNRVSASKMVGEGVKSGVHDIFLPVAQGGYYGLYIEMKTPNAYAKKNHNLSDKQMEFKTFIEANGYCSVVCSGWEDASEWIIRYLKFPRTQIVQVMQS